MSGILDSLDRADELSKKRPKRRTVKRYSKKKDIEAYRKTKDRASWGAMKFAAFFYATMKKEGVEIRDTLGPDGDEILPKYVKEMGRVLDWAERYGYLRQEVSLALEFLAREWYQGIGSRFPKNTISMFDLRYELESIVQFYRTRNAPKRELPPLKTVEDLLKGRKE